MDKIRMIRDLLENIALVNLFMRLRRFGKTLNMSMLKYFFENGQGALALLSKSHTKQNIEVKLEMSEMDLTQAESKTTYEEIKYYVLEHTGLRVSNLYIAQIKQNVGLLRE